MEKPLISIYFQLVSLACSLSLAVEIAEERRDRSFACDPGLGYLGWNGENVKKGRRQFSLFLIASAVAGCWGCSNKQTHAVRDEKPAPSAMVVLGPAPASSGSAKPSPTSKTSNSGKPTSSNSPSAAGIPEEDQGFAPGVVPVAALAFQTPVHKKPIEESTILGYLRAGQKVATTGPAIKASDCSGGWYPIAPAGFVCVRKDRATLDLDHELVRAYSRRPDSRETLPYMYGIARHPGPIYSKLPTRKEAAAAEKGMAGRIDKWLVLEGHNGAMFRHTYWHRWKTDTAIPEPKTLWEQNLTREVPWYLENGKIPPGNLSDKIRDPKDVVVDQMKNHNGFAILDTAVREGRRYAVTTRMLVIPVDRLRPIEGSAFHGVRIPEDIHFPFALIRRRGAVAYRLDGKKLIKEKDVPHRAALQLSGKQKMLRGRLHYQTADGFWISDRVASRLDPAKHMPKWGKNGEHWLDVNISKQTLVAYDGEKAVFATLVSTGEAGLGDPETSKATKRGIFRIHSKHVTATMDSDVVGEEFELQDIPYVQYFEGGYALHAAYWHDDFGKPRSHGCINLAPADAKYLFSFTKPELPKGWHSIREPLRGSVVFVHP
jgi:hypothetical protein